MKQKAQRARRTPALKPSAARLLCLLVTACAASSCHHDSGQAAGAAGDSGTNGITDAGASDAGASGGFPPGTADNAGGPSRQAGGSANTTAGAAGKATAPDAAAGTIDSTAGAAGTPEMSGGAAGTAETDGGSGPLAGAANAGSAGTGTSDSSRSVLVPAWSVKKLLRSDAGQLFALEETEKSFLDPAPDATRIVRLASDLQPLRTWDAPAGFRISDYCLHASGQFSVVLIAPDHRVALVRLAPDLSPLSTSTTITDPDFTSDPHALETGVTDLVSHAYPLDPARVGTMAESAVVAVTSNINSVIAYRFEFEESRWSLVKRTLVEPPGGISPLLPIGGSFDTFGAMAAWFRCSLDVDEQGNAFIAVWAGQSRIRRHTNLFHDGLTPLSGPPQALSVQDSDVLLSKLSPDGVRLWSRVVGSPWEDEPYALRARNGLVAVVGRSRRFPGFDNTFWDAFLSVTNSNGGLVGTRTIPLDASGILLGVDVTEGNGFVLAGSDGWAQNPSGLSVLSYGAKLLLELPALADVPFRHSLPAGPRHNEIRSVVSTPGKLWFGGHEDGAIMHTGDSDVRQVHATGIIGVVPR